MPLLVETMILLVLLFVSAWASPETCRASLTSQLEQLATLVTDSGSLGSLGKADECTLVPFAHYCLFFLGLSNASVPWGLCVPKNCSATDLGDLITPLLVSVGGNVQFSQCGWPDQPWTGGAIACIVVFSLFAAAGLAVTFALHCISESALPSEGARGEKQQLLESINMEEARRVPPKRHLLLRAFDWGRAVSDLAAPTPAALRALDGVRTFAILWIVLGHTLSFNQQGFDNPNVLQRSLSNDWRFFLIVSVGLRNVDTFFFFERPASGLSGD